jgi:hypothetical protein
MCIKSHKYGRQSREMHACMCEISECDLICLLNVVPHLRLLGSIGVYYEISGLVCIDTMGYGELLTEVT